MERQLGTWPMMVERDCASEGCHMRFRVRIGDPELLCPKHQPRSFDDEVSVSNPLEGTYSVGIIRVGFVKTLGMLRPKGID